MSLAWDHVWQQVVTAVIGLWGPPLFAMGWLAMGAGVGLSALRHGHSQELAAASLLAWPFVLPMVWLPADPVAPATPEGPYAGRIRRTVASVEEALAEAGVQTPPAVADLRAVAASLHDTDARIARVDRLLASGDPSADGEVAAGVAEARLALMALRQDASAELQSLLDGLAQLRLQIGHLVLTGEGGAVDQRMRELAARVAALHELAGT